MPRPDGREQETGPRIFLGDDLARARSAAGFNSRQAFADRPAIGDTEGGDWSPPPEARKSWCEPAPESAARALVTSLSEVVRAGLCTMLATLPGVVTVLAHADPARSAELLASGGITVVVAAPPLPARDHTLVAEAAARKTASILVLLRDYELPGYDVIAQAVSLPADGYLLESSLTPSSLGHALRQLGHGQSPMPVMLARGLVDRARSGEAHAVGRQFLLTAREISVLSLMADGQTNKEIARRLTISVHGVKRHVACVLAKLNCPNRTAAAALFLQQGTPGIR